MVEGRLRKCRGVYTKTSRIVLFGPIKLTNPSKRLQKVVKKLPRHVQENIEDLVKEIESGTIPPGRKAEKVKSRSDVVKFWLSSGYRIAVQTDDEGHGRFVHVDTRSSFYESLKRKR